MSTDLIARLRAASAGTEEWRVLSKDGGIVMWYSRDGSDAVLNPEREAREWLRQHKADGYSLGDRVERAITQTQNQRLMAEAADALASVAADRDKYKAFAEQYARMLVEHGIIKDVSREVPGVTVEIDASITDRPWWRSQEKTA